MTALRWGALTDAGRVRPNNEDQLLIAAPLFAVADGMGGHQGGEVAAQVAVDTLRDAFEGKTHAVDLVEAVRAANRAVFERAQSDRGLHGMGTTLTAVAVVEADDGSEELAIANVGDSRSYLLRDGELERLTDDHNVPGELLRRGEITEAEAAAHPQKNLITRTIGNDEDVEVDLFEIVPYVGDRLLLASDGLAGEAADDDIASILRREADPDAAAHALVELAKRSGSTDNITVIVVDVTDDDDRAEAASAALATSAPPRSRGRRDDDVLPAAAPTDADDVLAPNRPHAADDAPRSEEPRSRAVTPRVVAFLVALLLVVGGLFAFLEWYGRGSYYVGLAGDRVTIYRGRPGGFLWVQPSPVASTRLRAEDVLPARQDDLRRGHQEPSLVQARRYVDNLADEATTTTTTTTASTTTTAPPAPGAPPGPATPPSSR